MGVGLIESMPSPFQVENVIGTIFEMPGLKAWVGFSGPSLLEHAKLASEALTTMHLIMSFLALIIGIAPTAVNP